MSHCFRMDQYKEKEYNLYIEEENNIAIDRVVCKFWECATDIRYYYTHSRICSEDVVICIDEKRKAMLRSNW